MKRRSSHRYILSVGLTALLILASPQLTLAAKWRLVKPCSGSRVTLRIKDKNRTYYRLDQGEATVLRVKGPGRLKAISRLVFTADENEELYSIIANRDGKKRYRIARATVRSMEAVNPNLPAEMLGQSRSMVLNIPDGEHEFRFFVPEGENHKIYARFLVSNGEVEEVDYVAYLPRRHGEEVHISVKERRYIYYRTNNNSQVELEVNGPTTVKCIARLEFDHTMRGDKPYRVQVEEDDKVVLTQPFTASPSATATYINPSEYVLGKGDVLSIGVPAGKHRYKVFSPDKGLSVLFRFYLPQGDLGREATGGGSTRAGSIDKVFRNPEG